MATRILLITLLLALLTPFPAGAFSAYRCRNHIVTVGDRQIVVETKCGEPKSRSVIGEVKYKSRHMSKKMLVEEWVYDRYGWFDVLTFRGGKLTRIEMVRKW